MLFFFFFGVRPVSRLQDISWLGLDMFDIILWRRTWSGKRVARTATQK